MVFKEAELDRFRVIKVKYLPATENRGPRVKLTDTWKQQSHIITYSHSMRDAMEVAINYCANNGAIPDAVASTDGINSDLLLFSNFARPILPQRKPKKRN